MKKLIFILPALCFALSCAAMPQGRNEALVKDQVHAQNRVMKKNLDLALRENEVLKTENAQYKSQVKKLDCTISKLNADLESLNTKYNEDTASLNEEIARLNESYEIIVADFTQFEQKSDQTIHELTEQNAQLKNQLADETVRLNGIIKEQKASFDTKIQAVSQELASTKAGCASREKDLHNQLSELNRKSVEKDAAIKSLEARQQAGLEKAAALEKTIREQAEKIRKMEKADQELMESRRNLQKTIEEKQAIIDKLSRKPDPTPAPVPQTDPKPVKQPK